MDPINKNVIFYPNNKYKSHKVQCYYSAYNIYTKEINEININFINGGDQTKLIKSIDLLLKKMNLFKDKENYNNYIPLQNLFLFIDNSYKKNKLNKLLENKKINEDNIILDNKKILITKNINIIADIKINKEFINYIKKHGLPENGIFLPSKLYLLK
jgi:hypothetical protein